jgi:hypothetical protein
MYFFLILFLSSSLSLSSLAPLTFYQASPLYPSISFHNLSVHDRHLYLEPSVSSIPCGYMIPTELDIFRTAQPTIPTLTQEGEFLPCNCTIMIIRLLFGAYEVFNPRARKYPKLSSRDRGGEILCYLLITDSLSLKTPIIAENLLVNSSSPVSSHGYSPWHVFVMKNLIYSNPAKTMKTIKMSLFRLFPFVKYILYYDLKFQLTGNPLRFLDICNNLMTNSHTSHAIYRGLAAEEKTIETEFIGSKERLEFLSNQKGVVHNLTQELNDMERQFKQYQAEGFFDQLKEKRQKGQQTLLVDSAIIVFKNHNYEQLQPPQPQQQQLQNDLHRFFCAWLNEVILYSRRDQLSYPYIEHKLNITGLKIPPVIVLRFFQKIPHRYVARLGGREREREGQEHESTQTIAV